MRDGVAIAGTTPIAAATHAVPDGAGLLYVRPHDVSLGLPARRASRRGARLPPPWRDPPVEIEVGSALFEADIAPDRARADRREGRGAARPGALFVNGGPGVDCRAPAAQQPGEYAIEALRAALGIRAPDEGAKGARAVRHLDIGDHLERRRVDHAQRVALPVRHIDARAIPAGGDALG